MIYVHPARCKNTHTQTTQKIYIKHASRSPKVLKVKCNLSKNSNNSIRSSDVLLAQGEQKIIASKYTKIHKTLNGKFTMLGDADLKCATK